MSDTRQLCEFTVNGLRHQALLDEYDQKRYNATPVSAKQAKAANKARTAPNKSKASGGDADD